MVIAHSTRQETLGPAVREKVFWFLNVYCWSDSYIWKPPFKAPKNHRRGTKRVSLGFQHSKGLRSETASVWYMAGAFRLGKRTIRYTPLCDPSMAPIHSDRERRHSLSSPPPRESDGPSPVKSHWGGGQSRLLCITGGEMVRNRGEEAVWCTPPPPNRYKQAVEEEVLRSDCLAHNAAEWHYIVNYQIIISA